MTNKRTAKETKSLPKITWPTVSNSTGPEQNKKKQQLGILENILASVTWSAPLITSN